MFQEKTKERKKKVQTPSALFVELDLVTQKRGVGVCNL